MEEEGDWDGEVEGEGWVREQIKAVRTGVYPEGHLLRIKFRYGRNSPMIVRSTTGGPIFVFPSKSCVHVTPSDVRRSFLT